MPSRTVLLILMLLVALPAVPQEKIEIPRGSKIFIEEMEHDLDGYLRAEIIKKKVAVEVVLNAEDADYILKGSATEQEKRKWHEGWLTAERDKTEGNVYLVDPKSEKLVWASEAGDRSVWWGALKRGGHRKVADRLVNNLKKIVAKR